MRPRVLHLVPALFGEGGVFGGAERYAYELARHMADQTSTRLVTFADAPARLGYRTAQRSGPWPSLAEPRAAEPDA